MPCKYDLVFWTKNQWYIWDIHMQFLSLILGTYIFHIYSHGPMSRYIAPSKNWEKIIHFGHGL